MQANQAGQQTFFEHMEEFRRRLLWSLAVFAVIFVGLFFFSDHLMTILTAPIRDLVPEIYFFSPFEAMVVKVKAAMVAAAVLSAPFWMAQGWLFIKPALSTVEATVLFPGLIFLSILFLAGSLFCFWTVLPGSLSFLMGMQSDFLKPMISAARYLDFVFGMLLAFGLAFNLPVFLIGFTALGVINAKGLARFRKYALFFIFIAAAILTPSPDVASQILLAVPLALLYELSVFGAWILGFMKKRKAA